uniref:E3 ubiquitin-protein ligase n=1 Tax=Timema douglasi TaxID=61478 RepID=A0A7R8VUY0_TIMDO|nr:unnamed protein product [Timema douglasi]
MIMVHCPCQRTSCGWKGPLEQSLLHVNTSHECIDSIQRDGNIFSSVGVGFDCKFFAFTKTIGSRGQAKTFKYELELKGPKHQLALGTVTTSIHQDETHAFMRSKCLMLDKGHIPL